MAQSSPPGSSPPAFQILRQDALPSAQRGPTAAQLDSPAAVEEYLLSLLPPACGDEAADSGMHDEEKEEGGLRSHDVGGYAAGGHEVAVVRQPLPKKRQGGGGAPSPRAKRRVIQGGGGGRGANSRQPMSQAAVRAPWAGSGGGGGDSFSDEEEDDQTRDQVHITAAAAAARAAPRVKAKKPAAHRVAAPAGGVQAPDTAAPRALSRPTPGQLWRETEAMGLIVSAPRGVQRRARAACGGLAACAADHWRVGAARPLAESVRAEPPSAGAEAGAAAAEAADEPTEAELQRLVGHDAAVRALGAPSAEQLARFDAFRHILSGKLVLEAPPGRPPAAAGIDGGDDEGDDTQPQYEGAQPGVWVTEAEALRILGLIDQERVTLALMEASGICTPLSALQARAPPRAPPACRRPAAPHTTRTTVPEAGGGLSRLLACC